MFCLQLRLSLLILQMLGHTSCMETFVLNAGGDSNFPEHLTQSKGYIENFFFAVMDDCLHELDHYFVWNK